MAEGADVRARFGKRVRDLRNERGISQSAFAAQCGLDRTYLGGIERGERNVALCNIEVIANAFGLTISQLTEGL
jgi:transcriptional regulator with XRE-family HTH domain